MRRGMFCEQPHLTLIDNITLAVFEDSGWYRVNYDYADNFQWGRGILYRTTMLSLTH